jgi:hypothetical protein
LNTSEEKTFLATPLKQIHTDSFMAYKTRKRRNPWIRPEWPSDITLSPQNQGIAVKSVQNMFQESLKKTKPIFSCLEETPTTVSSICKRNALQITGYIHSGSSVRNQTKKVLLHHKSTKSPIGEPSTLKKQNIY